MSTHWTDGRIDHFRRGAGQGLWTDAEVAGKVRMLLRNDLDHETVCVAARDRIATLSRDVHELTEILHRLVTNHSDHIEKLPGETGMGDLEVARALLVRIGDARAAIDHPDTRKRADLIQERADLMNQFGFSSFRDGRVRDRITAIDAELQKVTA